MPFIMHCTIKATLDPVDESRVFTLYKAITKDYGTLTISTDTLSITSQVFLYHELKFCIYGNGIIKVKEPEHKQYYVQFESPFKLHKLEKQKQYLVDYLLTELHDMYPDYKRLPFCNKTLSSLKGHASKPATILDVHIDIETCISFHLLPSFMKQKQRHVSVREHKRNEKLIKRWECVTDHSLTLTREWGVWQIAHPLQLSMWLRVHRKVAD